MDDLVLLREFTGEQVEYCGQAHQFMSSDSILGTFVGGVSDSAKDFRPLSDNLLVKISEAATSTSSGIALAVGDTESTPRGDVVQAGPGRTTSLGGVAPMDVVRRNSKQPHSARRPSHPNRTLRRRWRTGAAAATPSLPLTRVALPAPQAIGDSVMFQPYSGSDVNLGGKKYKVVRASDCLAKW